jgi:hypothetical protein
MSRKLLVLAALLAPVAGPAALAGPFDSHCCPSHHCPPRYQHCQEPGPHPHFHKGCPRPVCGPCDLVNWGYYETCWRPWPFPTNWAHCPVPPYAAFVPEHPGQGQRQGGGPPGATPRGPGGNGGEFQLPPPRKLDSGFQPGY